MFSVVLEMKERWPDNGTLHLDAHFIGEVTVSPSVARQRAGGFFAGDVTMMVLAGEPALVLAQPPVWRVPAALHLPGMGAVATIGWVDVDATSGEVISPPPEQIAAIQRQAHAVAARLTLPPTPAV